MRKHGALGIIPRMMGVSIDLMIFEQILIQKCDHALFVFFGLVEQGVDLVAGLVSDPQDA